MIARLRAWLVPRLHRLPFVRALGRRLLRGRTVRQPFHGGVICLDAIDHSLMWTGALTMQLWDDDIQDRLLAISRDCVSMIDLGSNVGTMSLSVALRNPSITIVCVDPNPRACALLREAIALNRLGDRVTVIEAAAGDADGVIAFDARGSETGHIVSDRPATTRRLDAARLIDEAASRGRCLVKMDVEGYEPVVVASLSRLASRRHIVLAAELHARGFHGYGDPAACVAMLQASGAVVTDPDGTPLATIEPWTDDLVTRQIEARWPS